MERPADLFDREREWDDLVSFAGRSEPGIGVALVRGRRRQGKSFLLRRLVEATGGFYHQALEQGRSQALAGFGVELARWLDVPGRLAFEDWDGALGALSAAEARVPPVVVLDEFPYLLGASPELPSVLQRTVDTSRRPGAPSVRLVICGSALAVMASLLEGTQALRGRASHDLVLGPFDYRLAAAYWGIDDPAAAFAVDAVAGGTPGYRDLLPGPAPGRTEELADWLASGVLNPASALFREDDYLLAEDRSLSDRALYHAVVGAIAGGATRQHEVASRLGRESRAVQHPLGALEEAGFVVRHDDVFRDRRPVYRLADPIVRFHHVVTRPDLARFEDRRVAEAWADARGRFASGVLGPHFEHVAREFTFRFAAPATVGGAVARVGPGVINDARARAQHELDVVALGRRPDGGTTVLALGEAKHTVARRDPGDLARLEHIRRLLVDQGRASPEVKLLVFSAAGFDPDLEATARHRDDVELIDLDRLYGE